MHPCDFIGRQSPALYTYYALMSLLVVVLAISLIWMPFLQLVTEINVILARVVIYCQAELLGYKNACVANALFLSQKTLVTISVCCVAYTLYLASSDFLLFAGCYVCTLPNTKRMEKVSNKVKSKDEDSDSENDYVSGTDYGSRNKLILIIRTDLKMGKGKVAAQCSHAAVMAHEACRKKFPEIFSDWKRNGQPKIVVKVDSEEEMLELYKEAKNMKLLVNIVQDAGRTQVAPGSRTVLAVGPGPETVVNQVTGHLSLY